MVLITTSAIALQKALQGDTHYQYQKTIVLKEDCFFWSQEIFWHLPHILSNNASGAVLMKRKRILLVLAGSWVMAGVLCLAYSLYHHSLYEQSLEIFSDLPQDEAAEYMAEEFPGSGETEGIPVSGEEEPDEWGKQIALTFDDGPHPVYTKKLLDGLRERNVKATFFLIGDSITGNEELIQQMQKDGHLIGNHTSSHVQLSKKTTKEAREEIRRTNQRILEVTGKEPVYIRPPFGSWSEELETMVPMTVVLWDVDPLDWKVQDQDKVVRHVLKYVEDGDIILLHDVYETSVDAALEIIDTLSCQGYNFVTAEELLID